MWKRNQQKLQISYSISDFSFIPSKRAPEPEKIPLTWPIKASWNQYMWVYFWDQRDHQIPWPLTSVWKWSRFDWIQDTQTYGVINDKRMVKIDIGSSIWLLEQ